MAYFEAALKRSVHYRIRKIARKVWSCVSVRPALTSLLALVTAVGPNENSNRLSARKRNRRPRAKRVQLRGKYRSYRHRLAYTQTTKVDSRNTNGGRGMDQVAASIALWFTGP